MDDANLTYDVFSSEAFIASNIAIRAVEEVGSKTVTPCEIVHSLESIKSDNFQGIQLNFDRSTRTLARHVWIETGDVTALSINFRTPSLIRKFMLSAVAIGKNTAFNTHHELG